MKKIIFTVVLVVLAANILTAKTTLTANSGSLSMTESGAYDGRFSGKVKFTATDNAVKITAEDVLAHFSAEGELSEVVVTGEPLITMFIKKGSKNYKFEASADTIVQNANQNISLKSAAADSWIRITSMEEGGSAVTLKAGEILFDGESKITATVSPTFTGRLVTANDVGIVNGVAKTITATITDADSIIRLDGSSRLTSKSTNTNQSSDIKADSITIYPNAENAAKSSKKETVFATASGNVKFTANTDVAPGSSSSTVQMPAKQLWTGDVDKLNFVINSKEEQVLNLTGVRVFSLLDRENRAKEPVLNMANVKGAYINLKTNEWGINNRDDK